MKDFKILEVKMKCEQCNKEFTFNNIELVEAEYNQYVVDICDMGEEFFGSYHCCEEEQ